MTERAIETIRVDLVRGREGDLWPSPDITAFVDVAITWSDGSTTIGQTFAECAEPNAGDVAAALEDAGMPPAPT